MSEVGTRIKLAETAEELDQLFELRHRVLVEECGYASVSRDRRLCDRFDAFPGVANIVAIAEGRVLGGMRVVETSRAGAPAQDYFDFSPYLRGAARVGSIGMLAILPECRKRRIFFRLANGVHRWAMRRSITHLIAALAPGVEPLVLRLGYRALAPRFTHSAHGLEVTPVLLELSDLAERLSASAVAEPLDCGPFA